MARDSIPTFDGVVESFTFKSIPLEHVNSLIDHLMGFEIKPSLINATIYDGSINIIFSYDKGE